ncbi:MAG: M48 family metallopeptidase [Planctomycetota bacterium]
MKKDSYPRINMSSTIVEIPTIGAITIVKSQRAKHIRITIKPDQTVRLTIPRGQSVNRAKQFLHSKIPWIVKHQHRFSKLEDSPTNLPGPKINELEARDILISRLEELAKIHNFKYAKVSIRNQKTKWGSCSAKNNISLNINLARVPDELRDYVILHELVHTRFKNHSKKFWAELDKVIGSRAKELSKKLKNYRLPGTT